MSLEDFIITVYCLVADIYDQLPDTGQFRSRGFAPALSDGEVITMEIIRELVTPQKILPLKTNPSKGT